ncbi:hypothetical protein BpHYR1_015454 [Brachionus plicatilis]|uniref:Uncharacterized protein n=1 Tax=Brachionus plicatilis TaxID=10195 RepID=A0A3M7PTK8_BRAPC|nr:hypothetical protein BpHYR1_015454 [Brachionus plicatilis]
MIVLNRRQLNFVTLATFSINAPIINFTNPVNGSTILTVKSAITLIIDLSNERIRILPCIMGIRDKSSGLVLNVHQLNVHFVTLVTLPVDSEQFYCVPWYASEPKSQLRNLLASQMSQHVDLQDDKIRIQDTVPSVTGYGSTKAVSRIPITLTSRPV